MYDENKKIVICSVCHGYEYWGSMIWLDGICQCRKCYKNKISEIMGKPYPYKDLDGHVPTEKEFLKQKENHEHD